MTLSKVPQELVALIDKVASVLSLPKVSNSVKWSSIRPSYHGHSIDFIVCLAHPEWKEWLENIDQVKNCILKRDPSQILQIELCKYEDSFYLYLTLDRIHSIPRILSLYDSYYRLAKLPKIENIDCNREIFTFLTVKPPDNSWNCLRIQLFSSVTAQMVNSWSTKYTESNFIEIIDDKAEWLKEVSSDDVSAELAFLSGESVSSKDNNEYLVSIDNDVSIDPPVTYSQIKLKHNSTLLHLVSILKSKVGKIEPRPHLLVIFVSARSFAKMHKALVLSSLSFLKGVPIRIFAIENVSCDDSIEDFNNHLKNMLIAQSIEDDYEDDENSTNNSLPTIDSSKVLNLFQTCIRCNLLSVKYSSSMTLSHAKNRNYLFIQYNIARIESILNQYFKQVERVDFSSIQLSHLTSDHEWSLVLNYVLPFIKLTTSGTKSDSITLHPDKLINFACNLAKDVGCYYSKTRILKDHWQNCPIVKARIHLLQVVQGILIDIMKVIGVEPVLKM